MKNDEDYEVIYKSKKTGKSYSSKEDLKADETKWELAHKAEIEKAENRKKDAEAVETARKHYNEVCKQCDKEKAEAYTAYSTALNDFMKKYGSYHYSVTSKDIDDIEDLFWNIGNIFRF
jgi:hypothetical protein